MTRLRLFSARVAGHPEIAYRAVDIDTGLTVAVMTAKEAMRMSFSSNFRPAETGGVPT